MRLVYRGINGDQSVETVVPPEKIVQNSLVITDNICSGGRFHTGGVISKMMSIKLIDNDYNPSYSDIVIRQKYILEDSRTVVFPMGTFEVSAESVRKERMFTSFEGYDYLVKLDKEISDADKRDFDSIVSSHLIDLPLYLYIEFAAEKCGLAINSAAFEALDSFGWTLLTNPKGASRSAPFTLYRARLMGATYRDLVSSVATLAGCAIKLDREGRLTPVSFLPKTADKTFTADNSISRSINDKWSVIHFVTYASWQSYRSGDFETGETIYDEATLSLPSNVLMFDSVEDYNEAAYAEYVVQKAVDQETTGITSDLKLINAEIKYFGDPGLDAGDYVVSQQNWLDTQEVGFWVMEHVWKPHQPCVVRAFGAPSSSTYASGRDYGQATRTTRVNTTTSEEVIALQNQVSVNTSYSTGEHSVGKWLDGYTLYEKTYVFDSLGALTAQQALEIEDLRSVVESRGQLIGEGYSMPMPIVPISSDGESLIPEDAVAFKIDTANELLIVEHGATDRSSEQAYITLKYTRNAPATIPTVYGFHIDPSISDPAQAVTYLADAVGKTPAAMGASEFSYGGWADAFFMPKPCMLRSDGTVAYYLDPNDYTKKADGTPSDVGNVSFDGNAMMEWPLIWYKFEAGETEGEGYFYCSNQQVDSSYKCWCNINSQNEVTEHFYTAIYNGTGTSKLRSISGVQLTQANGSANTTGQQELSRSLANNTTNSVEWYTEVWSDRVLISALLILISKSLNNQAAFGNGLVDGSQTAKDAYVTGALNDKGLFWGSLSSDASGVKVFGMENFYGCIWRRIAGLIGTSAGFAYKLTYGTADGSTATGYNSTGTGYLTVSGKPNANGNVKTMNFGFYGFLPETVGGNETDYWSEYFYTGSSGYAIVGGASYGKTRNGASDIALGYNFSVTNSLISTVLSCKPVAVGR